MAMTLYRGSIQKIVVEKDAADKPPRLVLLFEEAGAGTGQGGFSRHSFDLPDDRALRNLKDDIDTELNRRRTEAASAKAPG